MPLQRVLVANRGEIAIRLIKACHELNIETIAIYTEEDCDALHTRLATKACALDDSGSRGYLNVENIIQICRSEKVEAVIPGYGFLSEDASFAEALQDAGILFIGPTPASLREFGLKHCARELAVAAQVPVVPGTDMMQDLDEAIAAAERLGYPIMVKATAGGGGMGLQVCRDTEQLRSAFVSVQSRGSALFHNAGLFLEKYIESGRHIEGQIFANGLGDVLWFGERECSIQRRHQKVIEEAPSPFVLKNPHLREKLQSASVSLAKSVKYKSVGTIEFLVDDETGDFYFLEMNTRLQVEHGVTELCYGVDLVHLMLLQASAEFDGNGGLQGAQFKAFERQIPVGHAIECRVYAENPAKNFMPTPGLLQHVNFPSGPSIRVDSWVESGTIVSPAFDPLLAKILVFGKDRPQAIRNMTTALTTTILQGPPTNVRFLTAIMESESMKKGYTLTNMLSTTFSYNFNALEFLTAGTYTTIQDWPGRKDVPNGVPVSGPMDDLSFRVANCLVGNTDGVEGFEFTFTGARILSHGHAIVAVCGANFKLEIGGKPAKLWTRYTVLPGTEINIGGLSASQGCRGYLAVRGGLPDVATYLGSKSTTTSLQWGGHQGRTIRGGDFFYLSEDKVENSKPYTLPETMIPVIKANTTLLALPGPYADSEFLSDAGLKHLFTSEWTVGSNSNRTGVQILGEPPIWSRTSGGDGGSHPSNIIPSPYPLGGTSFTGDSGVIFPVDAGNVSGFVCVNTVAACDRWRLGQMTPGTKFKFQYCSWSDALRIEREMTQYLTSLKATIRGVEHSDLVSTNWSVKPSEPSTGLLYDRAGAKPSDRFVIRQAGERSLLCFLGLQTFDLRVRSRVQQIYIAVRDRTPRGLLPMSVPGDGSIMINFDPTIIDQAKAVEEIVRLEASLPADAISHIPSRKVYLPTYFDAPECEAATLLYMEKQRPYASYLPDNVDFVRRSNNLEKRDDVFEYLTKGVHLDVSVGWFKAMPICTQVNPLLRLSVPKCNPPRTFTPSGAVGIGGINSAIYPMNLPGGFLLLGMTIPGCTWDTFGRKPGFQPSRPWLFETFDQIIYEPVSEDMYRRIVRDFNAGHYKIRIEESTFDVSAHSKVISDSAIQISEWNERQREGEARESILEAETLQRWQAEKAEQALNKSLAAPIEIDPNHIAVVSTLNASVWKIQVNVGDVVNAKSIVAILEAMKMEINVLAPDVNEVKNEKFRIVAIVKEAGDAVEAGDVVLVVEGVE